MIIKMYFNEFNNLALKINEAQKTYKVMLRSKMKTEQDITFVYPTKIVRMKELLQQCIERGFTNEKSNY